MVRYRLESALLNVSYHERESKSLEPLRHLLKQRKEDLLWCGLTLAVTILVRGLMLGVFPAISTGDMGKDFYGAWMVLQGKWPCRDFWWQYGPMMPLYYAFWFLVGGVHLISFQVGLDMLYVGMALISFWAMRLFVSPPAAFLTSLAFLSIDPFWTFNHIGGIPFLLAGIFCLWKYWTTSRLRWCYFGTLAFSGMALVKASIAPFFFLAFFVSILFFSFIFRPREGKGVPRLEWKHWLFLPLAFGLLVGGAYLFIYQGLTFDRINQCLTLAPPYRTRDPIWTNMKHLVMLFLFWQWKRLIWTAGYVGLALLALRFFRRRGVPWSEQRVNLAAAGSLVLFFLASLAEFLLLGGNPRMRVTLWSHPILILLIGLLGGWASCAFSQPKRIFLFLLVFLWVTGVPLGVIGRPTFLTVSDAFAWRTPDRYLDFPHGRVYFGGGPEQLKIAQTIKQATQYLRENTDAGEKILAVPCEPLFCFLAGRPHAIWELILTDDHRLPERREDEMIRTLERESVRYVIQTNSLSFGIGSYRKLARYIFENYEEIKTFGSWEAHPTQALGAKIFRKKRSSV